MRSKSSKERELIRRFINNSPPRGHVWEEFVLEKAEHPGRAGRVFHFRADLVIAPLSGPVYLFEAKQVANPHQLGQILVNRELLREKFGGRQVVAAALCSYCGLTMRRMFEAFDIDVVVM